MKHEMGLIAICHPFYEGALPHDFLSGPVTFERAMLIQLDSVLILYFDHRV